MEIDLAGDSRFSRFTENSRQIDRVGEELRRSIQARARLDSASVAARTDADLRLRELSERGLKTLDNLRVEKRLSPSGHRVLGLSKASGNAMNHGGCCAFRLGPLRTCGGERSEARTS